MGFWAGVARRCLGLCKKIDPLEGGRVRSLRTRRDRFDVDLEAWEVPEPCDGFADGADEDVEDCVDCVAEQGRSEYCGRCEGEGAEDRVDH